MSTILNCACPAVCTHHVAVAGEEGVGSLGAEEAVHESHDAEGEVEVNVLVEVCTQVVTVEAVGDLKVAGRQQVHGLLLGRLRQERRQPLCPTNTCYLSTGSTGTGTFLNTTT